MKKELINILDIDFQYDDDRGSLVQLVHNGYNQVNVVKTKAGVVRGEHYHKLNKEVFYVVSGQFKLVAEKGDIREEYTFKTGDMFEVPPYVVHSFYYIQETILVALYDRGVELGDGEMDTYSS